MESLFTNIPLNETIEIVINRLFKNKLTVNGLDKKTLRKLLKIATQESHFLFRGMIFNQIDGVAMGSPLAPTLANIFMIDFEERLMPRLKEMGVKTWLRYVDDTFILIEKKDAVESILKLLNSVHSNIKFTFEHEQNNKLPFLDVMVRKEDGGNLVTSIYRKKTFTGTYLNWNSLTSREYKIGLIHCLLDRMWKICNNYTSIHFEIEKLKSILIKNDYPIKIINWEIQKFLNDIQLSKIIIDKADKKILYLVLPYIGKVGVDIKKRLLSLTYKYYPQVNLRVMFKSPFEIGKLFKFKDVIPKELRSNVVYKLTCKDCHRCYIGKTNRCLSIRMDEHKTGVNSNVHKHMKENNHYIDWENVEIIDKADNGLKLLLKEMLHINKLNPSINVQKQSYVFSMLIGRNPTLAN